MTRSATAEKTAAANSSTMKGPEGLAGKYIGRRCQTAIRVSLEGNGGLLASTPRNRLLRRLHAKCSRHAVTGNCGDPGGRT